MKKRYLTLILALLLMMSLLAGCGSGKTGSGSGSPAASSGAQQPTDAPEQPTSEPEPGASQSSQPVSGIMEVSLPLVSEPEVFTYFNMFNPNITSFCDGLEYTDVMDELAKRTNVQFQCLNLFPGAAGEQFGLMLSTDELPEFLGNCASMYPGGTAAAIADGYFADLTEYTEYMPNYMYYLNSNEEAYKNSYVDSGVLGNIVQIYDSPMVTKGPSIRKDWLDKAGMDIPVTYEDWDKVFEAFNVELGKTGFYCNDAIGDDSLLAGEDIYCGFNSRANEYPFTVSDGTVKFAMFEEGFKNYAARLADWWAKGYVSKDIAFIGTNDSNYRITTYTMQNGIGVVRAEVDTIDQLGTDNVDEGASFVAMRPAAKTAGQTFHTSTGSSINKMSYQVSSDCHDIALICQWINYLFSEDGAFLCNWGIEDKSFTYDAQGKPVYTELIANNPDGLSPANAQDLYAMQRGPFYTDSRRLDSIYSENQLAARDIWSENCDSACVIPSGMSLESADSSEFSNLYADIYTFIQETFYKFVSGEISMDQWEAEFVEPIKGMDIDRCVELYQKAYDVYMSR